eukprot:3528818-Amphidinium_carterae.2
MELPLKQVETSDHFPTMQSHDTCTIQTQGAYPKPWDTEAAPPNMHKDIISAVSSVCEMFVELVHRLLFVEPGHRLLLGVPL